MNYDNLRKDYVKKCVQFGDGKKVYYLSLFSPVAVILFVVGSIIVLFSTKSIKPFILALVIYIIYLFSLCFANEKKRKIESSINNKFKELMKDYKITNEKPGQLDHIVKTLRQNSKDSHNEVIKKIIVPILTVISPLIAIIYEDKYKDITFDTASLLLGSIILIFGVLFVSNEMFLNKRSNEYKELADKIEDYKHELL